MCIRDSLTLRLRRVAALFGILAVAAEMVRLRPRHPRLRLRLRELRAERLDPRLERRAVRLGRAELGS